MFVPGSPAVSGTLRRWGCLVPNHVITHCPANFGREDGKAVWNQQKSPVSISIAYYDEASTLVIRDPQHFFEDRTDTSKILLQRGFLANLALDAVIAVQIVRRGSDRESDATRRLTPQDFNSVSAKYPMLLVHSCHPCDACGPLRPGLRFQPQQRPGRAPHREPRILVPSIPDGEGAGNSIVLAAWKGKGNTRARLLKNRQRLAFPNPEVDNYGTPMQNESSVRNR